MKKILLTSALALTILTSMVAGTLATYTKTLAPLEGEISAKVFDITADKDASSAIDVKLAPTEEVDWLFDVRNYEVISLPTEVDMNLVIEVSVPTMMVDQGIVTTLTLGGEKADSVSEPVADSVRGTNTVYTYAFDNAYVANIAKKIRGTLNFNWSNFSGTQVDTETIASESGTFFVTITGNQAK